MQCSVNGKSEKNAFHPSPSPYVNVMSLPHKQCNKYSRWYINDVAKKIAKQKPLNKGPIAMRPSSYRTGIVCETYFRTHVYGNGVNSYTGNRKICNKTNSPM